MSEERHIDVAISGGGHRASVWGLGLLLYLSGAGLNPSVRTIASVSGGSLTNAVVALGAPYGTSTDFRQTSGSFANQMAGRVWAFWTALIGLLLLAAATAVAAIAGAGSSFPAWWPIVPLAASLALALGVGPLAGGSFWAWVGTWGYVALVVWFLIGTGAVWATNWELWARAVVFVISFGLVFWLIGIRNIVADRAFRATVCRRDGKSAKLSQMNERPQHVMCATDLQGPHHFYMSRDFLWSWDLGVGDPGDLRVATAVQASSNLPGAFPTRWLKTAGHGFVLDDPNADPSERLQRVALTDGGVYDNMGEQWADGLDGRLHQLRAGRLGPEIVVEKPISTLDGEVKLRLSDWGRLAVSASACPGGRIEPQLVEDSTGDPPSTTVYALVPARSNGETIAAGTRVRIDKRRGDVVTVAADHARVAARVATLAPEGAGGLAVLLVANASAGRGLARLKRSRIPLLGEFPGLMSVIGALYENGTTIRRRDLVGRWLRLREAEALSEQHGFPVPPIFTRGSDNGRVVQVDRSPWYLARVFAPRAGDVAEPISARAEEALTYLTELAESEADWECLAQENANVATTFRPLGAATTARLLYHAYVLSMIELHVLFGYPLLEDDPFGPSLDGFAAWVAGGDG